ncbi:sperm motility kinase 2B-like [Urocitellus parryii]
MVSQSRETSVGLQGPGSCKEAVFQDQYEVLRDIGYGGYGQVKLARHRLTGAEVAVKVVEKIEQNLQVLCEPDMMRTLEHPHVIQLFQVIETSSHIYMVMEPAGGGQLVSHVPEDGLQEEEARRLFRQMVCAVGYCHAQGIVHRDLKPDNILLDAGGNIKLIDFGLSTRVSSGQNWKDFWGSLFHLATRCVLKQAFEGPPVDIWRLGVILYFMLTGRCPFVGPTTLAMRRQIVLETYFGTRHLSVEARRLIHQILTLDPRKQPTVQQILQHPWLAQGEQYLPPRCSEALPKHPDPEIMTILIDMGYDPYKIWVSLAKRNFDTAMATYLILKHQKSQGAGCTFQGKPGPPRVKPRPHPVLPKRSHSEPALHTFPCELQLSMEDGQTGQKGLRRASLQAIHLPFLPASTPTPDTASQPDTGPPHNNRNRWKRVTRRIAACVRHLCCCLPRVSKKVVPV